MARAEYNTSVDSIVTRFAKSSKVDSWLDIGTGNGDRLVKLLKKINAVDKVICLEPSEYMHREATENLGSKAVVIQKTLEAYSYEQEKKFSIITALWNVIGHSDRPADFLKNAYEMLDKDGILLFDANNRYNIRQYGIYNVIRNAIWDLIGFEPKGIFKLKPCTGNEFTTVYISSPNDIYRACSILEGAKFQIHYLDYNTGKPTTWLSGQMVISVFKGSCTW
jgi:SAM-dependent methyltransferase